MTFDDAQLSAARDFINEAVVARGSAVEEVVRHNIVDHLARMYPDRPWWVREHIKRAEAQVHYQDDVDGTSHRAFVDVLVGRTTVEYEADLTDGARFTKGLSQVREHCAGLLNDGQPIDQILGVLSDTVDWHVYEVSLREGTSKSVGDFSPEDIELDPYHELKMSSPDQAGELLQFLVTYLGRRESRELRADTIAADLGFDSPFAAQRIDAVNELVQDALKANPAYADLISDLWTRFVDYLGAPEGDDTFDPMVYVAELYLVTLAKLLCANVIERKALISSDEELAEILDGEGHWFRQRGLLNLVEYDYFGWLNTPPHIDAMLPVAREIQTDLQAYDFQSPVGEDLFGHMMAQLARRSQRLLLGQESTPAWLARQIVEELDARLAASGVTLPQVLDMCSGSGALVVQLVRRAMDKATDEGLTGQDLVDRLMNAATGFDIDPLAVLLAKVNWVVNVRDVLAAGHEVIIPIYHADSLFSSNPLSQSGSDGTGDQVLTFPGATDLDHETTVALPDFIITPPYRRLFDRLIDAVYDMAMVAASDLEAGAVDIADCRVAVDTAAATTATGLDSDQNERLVQLVAELVTTLEGLQRADRNGIWAFILRNAYRPTLIAGQFDALATNPPWLALSKIADNPYRERLRDLAASFNVTPPGPSHLHTDLSTLFLLHAVDRYLAADAHVACILPETIVNGYQHTPFRRATYGGAERPVSLSLSSLWRVDKGTFKNEAVVLFGRNSADVTDWPIPGLRVSESASSTTEWQVLERGHMVAWAEGAATDDTEPWFDAKGFTQGADVMPRTLVLHRLVSDRRGNYSVSEINPRDKSDDLRHLLNTNIKRSKDFRIKSGSVSADYVYSVLLTSHLDPFHLHDPDLGILPFLRKGDRHVAATSSRLASHPASRTTIQKILKEFGGSAQDMLDYVESDRAKVTAQRPIRAWAHDADAAYLVVSVASGTYPCAAYRPLSELTPDRLVVDQTLYWALTDDENKALYLTGLINSDALHHIIRPFQPKGAAGERHLHTLPPKAIPPYDADDDAHKAVIDATQSLMSALDATIDPHGPLRDVSEWMPIRRKRIRAAMQELPQHGHYQRACAVVLGVDLEVLDGGTSGS